MCFYTQLIIFSFHQASWAIDNLTESQISEFKKSLKKFPVGTLQRWEKVAAHLDCSVSEVRMAYVFTTFILEMIVINQFKYLMGKLVYSIHIACVFVGIHRVFSCSPNYIMWTVSFLCIPKLANPF